MDSGIATRSNGVRAAAERATLVLATDLDGTFAGGTSEDRSRLQQALAKHESALLLYVTGRSVPAARELLAERDLPLPDVLIADVGTRVVQGPEFTDVPDLDAFLDARWPGHRPIREHLEGFAGIMEQDVHPPRRVSYWLVEGFEMDEVVAGVREAVADLGVDVIGSAGQYVDVLPGGVNKGATLFQVLDWLGANRDAAVVAGDTLNDLALFETGLRGVVVGNAESELVRQVGERENVYLAEREGAAGVHEALEFFGTLD